MSPEELHKHSKTIDKSVTWIEKQTEDVWRRYELIDECYTEKCEEEKLRLRVEMDQYIGKLHDEEKLIDKYEEIIDNTTGIK